MQEQNKTLREFICDLEKENYPADKIVKIVKEKLRLKPLKNISPVNDMLRELQAVTNYYESFGPSYSDIPGSEVIEFVLLDINDKLEKYGYLFNDYEKMN